MELTAQNRNLAYLLTPVFLSLSVFMAVPSAVGAPGGAGKRDTARQILETAGVQGGLVVHLGCGDARLTAALRVDDKYVVHGLAPDQHQVEQARERLRSEDVYGKVSVDQLKGSRLPYADNLVNLLVVEEPLGVEEAELFRVLAPLGVVMLKKGERWEEHVKPWPEEIDEWPHFLHGPDNNAVAWDRRVGPPSRLQWLAGPRHLRSHEHLNSVSALVSARGKIFYIIDEGPTASVVAPPKWRLVARDAFNGVLLWKRDLGPWEGHFRLFRSGPPDIARRLVAVDDRVYVTLGYGREVAALDAATGRTERTYEATEGALEIVHDGERMFVLVGTIDEKAFAAAAMRFYPSPPPRDKAIVAVSADSGRLLWKRAEEDTKAIMPTTLAVAAGRVFFQSTRQVVCLDAGSGEKRWQAERPVHTTRLSWSAPTLVATGDVVLSADGPTGGLPADARRGAETVEWIVSDTDIRQHPAGDLVAFSAKSGERLWTGESLQGFCSPGDVFVIDDLVWAGANVAPGLTSLDVGLDLKTGEVKKRRPGDGPPVGGHARCYRNKATERFLVLGGSGIELVNLADGNWTDDPWVRGTCQYGVMPANGMFYVPPDSCACLPNARLHGFTAMAPAGAERQHVGPEDDRTERLERGPAYAKTTVHHSSFIIHHSEDWPTYRNNPARSGSTPAAVSPNLRPAWRTNLGGRLTSLTAAGGRVYVARTDAHTVFALDVESGDVVWSRTLGGPVDSPPTISGGLAVFGCRDGWVYCLRASDGTLAWRYRAAPHDRLIVADGAVESAWPVHGSVLVRDGLVWCAAGRSSYLDGGIRLFALDLESGEPKVLKKLDARDVQGWPSTPKGGRRFAGNRIPGTLPDILSASGDLLYMGWTGFDPQGNLVDVPKSHLFSATGFLDDSWWHRTYWQWGTWMRGGFGGWPQAARQAPAGRLLVVGDEVLYGFGRSKFDAGNPEAVHAGHVGLIKDGYQESGHVDHSQNPLRLFSASLPGEASRGTAGRAGVEYRWQTPVPILVRAMVLADRTLLVAGPAAGTENRGLAELRQVRPGILMAVSAADGSMLAESELQAAPVLDGMAAIPGRALVSCTDGSVCCFAEK